MRIEENKDINFTSFIEYGGATAHNQLLQLMFEMKKWSNQQAAPIHSINFINCLHCLLFVEENNNNIITVNLGNVNMR